MIDFSPLEKQDKIDDALADGAETEAGEEEHILDGAEAGAEEREREKMHVPCPAGEQEQEAHAVTTR